jgi:arylsulfatase A-like enzyme
MKKRNKILVTVSLVSLLSFTSLTQLQAVARAGKPNVVLFLADDLGWRDVSCMGSQLYQTPHIDRLAADGMIFSDAHSANPLCSPTRHSIMSGVYPARSGMTSASGHVKAVKLKSEYTSSVIFPKAKISRNVSRLDTKYYTLAEAFKDNGYATGHFGKWHIGGTPYSPLEHGFEIDVPHYAGPSHPKWYAPYHFEKHNERLGGGKIPPYNQPAGTCIEEAMCTEAIQFIKANKKKPFFVNYWTYAVHGPYEAEVGDVDEFSEKIHPNDPQHNAIVADMVRKMDESMGRLVQTLKEEGVYDKTIIIFSSDNGGIERPKHVSISDFSDGNKLDRNATHPLNKKQISPTSNAPLRGEKATIYEGGTRVPMIVYAPGVTKSGSVCDDMVMSIDYYPTLAVLCGLEFKELPVLDGVDLTPALKGGYIDRDVLFCHWPHAFHTVGGNKPSTWVRKGNMKLIRFYCDGVWPNNRFELYDLENDPGEKTNLLSKKNQHQATLKELDALIDEHLKATGALVPVPDPKYGQMLDQARGSN